MNLDFSDLHILVVGDSMIDKFVYGRSERLSPEAPVPVMLPEQEENNLGGAANVVCNLLALGAKASLVSLIGADEEGKELDELLSKKLICSSFLLQDKSRRTTTKTRLLIDHKQILRIDKEDTNYINPREEQRILASISDLTGSHNYNAVILQDYNKGLMTDNLIKQCIALCQGRDIPVFVDPKHTNFFSYSGCTIFKPNIKELQHILQENIPISKDYLDSAILRIRQKINCNTIIVTLSEKGAYFNDGLESGIISTEALKSIDVSGAGDTFISIFSLMYLTNYKLPKCLEISNIVAGIACTKSNVVAVSIDEIINHLKS